MSATVFAALLAAGVLAVGAQAAHADDMKDGRAAFEALRLSAELARGGRAEADPWRLAVAARIRRMTAIELVDRVAGNGKAATEADATADWLDEAERLGGEDPRLLSLVQDIRSLGLKGRAGGPQMSRLRIAAGGAHHYETAFPAGRLAVIYVEGDGDTDLSLSIQGPSGETACSDKGPGDVKLCAWTVDRTGLYSVEVANQGRVPNRYALATN